MKRINARLSAARDSESGLTLIEVIIAMMIFAVVAAGVAFVLVSSLSATRDARAREVATNLAAQDLDLARSVDDVTTVTNKVTTTVLGGITYTLTRTTAWISSNGADATCGSTGGVLLYKHVNDRVTWSGARTSKTMVQSDTQLAPDGRLTDPAFGSILVSVLAADGTGTDGATVTVVPAATNPGTAVALTATPAVTDNQGCSYALKVAPGNYDVSVSETGYLSAAQTAKPTATVSVVAGNSATASFQLDQAATFDTTFASNSAAASVQFPTGLVANFASSNGLYSQAYTLPATKHLARSLFPFSSGYSVFTGPYVSSTLSATGATQKTCLSPDPGMWTANSAGVIGARSPSVGALPGQSASLAARMGVVDVATAVGVYITAYSVKADAAVKDPGCDSAPIYQFPTKTTAASTTIALPFGTWQLYTGTTVGAKTTLVQTASVALPVGTPTNATAGMFTLDPRVITQ